MTGQDSVGGGDTISSLPLAGNGCIDLIRGTIFDYVIYFRMAKAHECPYATVCKAVSEEA